jgi:hypothetical protein
MSHVAMEQLLRQPTERANMRVPEGARRERERRLSARVPEVQVHGEVPRLTRDSASMHDVPPLPFVRNPYLLEGNNRTREPLYAA